MKLNLPLQFVSSPFTISLSTGSVSGKERAFHFSVTEDRIEIKGVADAGVRSGCVFLEDLLNLREAPYLKITNRLYEPLFSPRMVHSGWGLDQFPDSHLNAILHNGFDSILLFVKGINHTTHGFMDFSNLIERAAKYSLKVYFYS